jgi:hypothetical protein
MADSLETLFANNAAWSSAQTARDPGSGFPFVE